MSVMVSTETYRPRLQQVVEELCTTVLCTQVQATAAEWNPEQKRVMSMISFTGEWKGTVSFECTVPHAVHFAQQMLGLESADGLDDDVRDALGELVNIVAGNLKSFMPAGVGMSTPTVIDGTGYEVWFPDTKLVSRDHFSTDGGDFWITLIECGN